MVEPRIHSGDELPAMQPKAAEFTIAAISGRFAHRFTGYSMIEDVPWYLAGVGYLQIALDGTLTGQQRSATSQILGQGAALTTTTYGLSGKVVTNTDGAFDATITFRPLRGDGLAMVGTFFVMPAGTTDRLWLVSSGACLLSSHAPLDELVSGEAVRIIAA